MTKRRVDYNIERILGLQLFKTRGNFSLVDGSEIIIELG
jgi:hypothetical protein